MKRSPGTAEQAPRSRDPHRALKDGVLVAPTLVKLGPGPLRKILGDLSDRALVLSILNQTEYAA